MNSWECGKGPKGFWKERQHKQTLSNETAQDHLYLNPHYQTWLFFFCLSLNPRLFHGFSFFLNFPCGMMSPPIWHPKILPCILMGSPDSPSIQPAQRLCLCLAEPGLRNTGQSALSSPHQVILLCSRFSVYLWFWRSEAVWGSFVLDLFSISLGASLSELISILIS